MKIHLVYYRYVMNERARVAKSIEDHSQLRTTAPLTIRMNIGNGLGDIGRRFHRRAAGVGLEVGRLLQSLAVVFIDRRVSVCFINEHRVCCEESGGAAGCCDI